VVVEEERICQVPSRVLLEVLVAVVLLKLLREQPVVLALQIKVLLVELVIQITPILGLVVAVAVQEPLVLMRLVLLHMAVVMVVLVLHQL
jgi:hypothetical protein